MANVEISNDSIKTYHTKDKEKISLVNSGVVNITTSDGDIIITPKGINNGLIYLNKNDDSIQIQKFLTHNDVVISNSGVLNIIVPSGCETKFYVDVNSGKIKFNHASHAYTKAHKSDSNSKQVSFSASPVIDKSSKTFHKHGHKYIRTILKHKNGNRDIIIKDVNGHHVLDSRRDKDHPLLRAFMRGLGESFTWGNGFGDGFSLFNIGPDDWSDSDWSDDYPGWHHHSGFNINLGRPFGWHHWSNW